MKRIVKGTPQNWSDAKLNYWNRVIVFVCVRESVRQKTQKFCPKYNRSPLFRRQYFTIVVFPISRSSSVNDTCSRPTDTNTTVDHQISTDSLNFTLNSFDWIFSFLTCFFLSVLFLSVSIFGLMLTFSFTYS